MHVQGYLSFEGRCDEALAFYQRAVGAKIEMLMRFRESPEAPPPGAPRPDPDKIMHCAFKVGDSTIFASDGMCLGKAEFKGFGLSLTVADDAAAERYFNALADGGQVTMPLAKTFWTSRFGMLLDKFGVCWMINVAH